MKHAGTPPAIVLTPAESKAMVDEFLIPLLQKLTDDAARISPDYETLWLNIQKLYKAGGKRLRSYMTFLTYEAFTTMPAKTIIQAAAAQELLHMTMLIHDDIIDRDDIRYGIKNIHGEYLDHYKDLIKDASDRQHYADSAAILAGDLLISEAYILITDTAVDPVAILKAQRLISKAVFHVIGGELLDTEASFRGDKAADPLTIAAQKTASYSFVSPFLMGATLAGAPAHQQAILQKMGEALGIAYQLRDDLLGVFGDKAKTGKSTDSDLREGKRTVIIKEFYKHATTTSGNEFDQLFGKHNLTISEITAMKRLIEQSSAKEATETLIETNITQARGLLDTLEINKVHHDAFSALIDLCAEREN